MISWDMDRLPWVDGRSVLVGNPKDRRTDRGLRSYVDSMQDSPFTFLLKLSFKKQFDHDEPIDA